MHALKRLGSLLTRKERLAACALTALALLSAFVEALGIGAVFPLLALLTQPEVMLRHPLIAAAFERTGVASYAEFVLLATAALMLAFVAKNLWLGIVYRSQAKFVSNVEARLGTELLAGYLYAPYVERSEQNSADRIRIITAELSRVTNGFLLPVVNIVAEGFVICALLVLLLVIQPQAAVFALLLMGSIAALVQFAFRKKLNEHRQTRVAANSSMYRAVSEGLGALKETKVMGREEHFVERFERDSRLYARSTTVFMTMNLLPRLIVETGAVAALAGCIAVAILTHAPLAGVVPMLTVFGLAAVRMMPSATRILGAANSLRYYAPSVEQVSEHAKSVRDLPRENKARVVRGAPLREFELRSVHYTYPGAASPILHDIDLRIARGEIVALTGRSGSGKTTLADIVLGLLKPTHGEIVADGKHMEDTRSELGTYAGLVPQHFFLLDDSVRRNVAFGVPDPEIEDERVWQALELAQLADRVRGDPLQLGMHIGEDGALLSGGERQRLAIARALYDDPGLLIFDEATSALDNTTEADIVETIVTVAKTKAVLAIAHRPALLRCATRIFSLEHGRLSELAAEERNPLAAGERAH